MPRHDDDEPDGLDRLRLIAVAVFIGLSALLVVATVLDRPVGDTFAGLVFGMLLALLGIEGLVQVVRRNGNGKDGTDR